MGREEHSPASYESLTPVHTVWLLAVETHATRDTKEVKSRAAGRTSRGCSGTTSTPSTTGSGPPAPGGGGPTLSSVNLTLGDVTLVAPAGAPAPPPAVGDSGMEEPEAAPVAAGKRTR